MIADTLRACERCGAGPTASYYAGRRAVDLCAPCALDAGFDVAADPELLYTAATLAEASKAGV